MKPHASTATVEVLTAQVRVLMVGSRQITLSVFRQLDIVDIESVRLMGRVNEGPGYHQWMIGVHRETGELVRARFVDDEFYSVPNQAEKNPAYLQRLAKYQRLPLIVLAGLR